MKMTLSPGGKAEERDEAFLLEGDEVVEGKSVFGEYTDLEMLSKLKALALNHCEPGVSRDSIRPLWNQTLQLRKVMALSNTEFPRRKRKLQQFLREKLKPNAELASDACNQHKAPKSSRRKISHASSSLSVHSMTGIVENLHSRTLLNSHSSGSLLTSEDSFRRQFAADIFILDNANEWGPPDKNIVFADSAASVNGSNSVTPEHMTLPESPLLDLGNSSNSSSLEEPVHECFRTPRRSIQSFNFTGNDLKRPAVPIGPHFQADVPEWSSSSQEAYVDVVDGDSDGLKWLGTQVWPVEGRNVKTTTRAIGKGRPNSCSCVSPRSTACIKRHILEARIFLQSELGPVFFIWKFNEMGEEVSKSWTSNEQEKFELLARRNLQSNGKNFLNDAMKFFPCKCRKDIVSFYFNVFIPHRMSLQNRSPLEQVHDDDDVDAVEDVYSLNFRRRYTDKICIGGSCKDVTSRYLRQN